MNDTSTRKGMPVWAWILIGCGTMMLLAAVAFGVVAWWGVGKLRGLASDMESNPALTTARMVVAANPELEEVAVDQDRGTMTIRNTTTGEEITVDFEAASQGRLSFSKGDEKVTIEADQGSDGTVKITSGQGELRFSTGEQAATDRPEWVVLYPAAEVTSHHALRHDTGVSGGVELRTADSVETVAAHFKSSLEGQGFTMQVASFAAGGDTTMMLTGTDEATGRTMIVNLRREEGATLATVSFNQGQPAQR